ncbi:phosphoribosylformylglycinamidine cyclo-ligase [cf. Phormidesmis sp. LEGE 11477]|uniref:phosphoribosylformylglycinamidine cyclo-ligase n=1 Tax=cf. Phormidesmis sp. LEGE 11477 TaxID=1828680 RepID=UPI00187E9751|nr:phosphoribosylformylglycinamidine cyclo-ligase [cf. Phormidesmis sp. LEGE 11477]MBE9059677.1 phosphoribosylformylglycinamidine cyclo-ligase [cf. Phormidesmis sp. LEGE 11477]
MDYKQAGVDVDAGRAFVDRIKAMVEGTYRPEVLGGLGGFGGCFELPSGYQRPVLVSGTDGVGTKLKLAQALDQHDTVGVDLVAMCVNDVLTIGAEPLFFLDYLATGKLAAEQLAQVVAGVANGCKTSGCALLGGETAEMPGFYAPGEYDIAGFCVGIVEKDRMLDGSAVAVGDRVIGLASSGVHSNGFSLVRKIVAEGDRDPKSAGRSTGYDWTEKPQILSGQSLGEVLLTPTQLYVKPILNVLRSSLTIHAMAHITGGGLPENLPRCLGKGQSIQIDLESWPVLPIFKWLQAAGKVSLRDMFNTFNMGVGFVVIVPPDQSVAACQQFEQEGIAAYDMGEVISGRGDLLGVPTA